METKKELISRTWEKVDQINLETINKWETEDFQKVCKILNKLDLFEDFIDNIVSEPDWLEGGTDEEQDALDSWNENEISAIHDEVQQQQNTKKVINIVKNNKFTIEDAEKLAKKINKAKINLNKFYGVEVFESNTDKSLFDYMIMETEDGRGYRIKHIDSNFDITILVLIMTEIRKRKNTGIYKCNPKDLLEIKRAIDESQ